MVNTCHLKPGLRSIHMKEYTINNDPVLRAIVEKLISPYQCHTIILYGSRARGDFTENCDYDVAVITKNGERNALHALTKNMAFTPTFLSIRKVT